MADKFPHITRTLANDDILVAHYPQHKKHSSHVVITYFSMKNINFAEKIVRIMNKIEKVFSLEFAVFYVVHKQILKHETLNSIMQDKDG